MANSLGRREYSPLPERSGAVRAALITLFGLVACSSEPSGAHPATPIAPGQRFEATPIACGQGPDFEPDASNPALACRNLLHSTLRHARVDPAAVALAPGRILVVGGDTP